MISTVLPTFQHVLKVLCLDLEMDCVCEILYYGKLLHDCFFFQHMITKMIVTLITNRNDNKSHLFDPLHVLGGQTEGDDEIIFPISQVPFICSYLSCTTEY